MMTTGQAHVESMRYRGWELLPDERAVLVGGARVVLGSRAFEVLRTLAQRPGEMVTKRELLESAWPNLIVEENNVSVQIAALRKIIGPEAITTISGLGYTLSAVRDRIDPAPSASMPPPITERRSADRPPRHELFGREQDIRDLGDCLAEARLLTIVGTGGVGKTSLARVALARRSAQLPPQTCWIDLAPVREPRQVIPLLAKSLGIELEASEPALTGLLTAIGQMTALVTIDNCEHVLDELRAVVQAALARAPRVRWLATSQEPFRVPGEVVYRLEPLAVPASGLSPSRALEFGAVALLSKCAVASDRRFRLDDSNVEAAIDLCRQLDGLPLAIEMAAARVGTFGLEEMRQRLGHRLRLLSAPREGAYRHSTLQATFDWSYGLLDASEQMVFRRLEPFLGGFRIRMAAQVTTDAPADALPGFDEGATMTLLGRLVDKSLVQRSPDTSGRFYLLESARDYARHCLQAAGETAAVQRRHAHAAANWFACAQEDADRMNDAAWIQRYVPERHNALAALAWGCREQDADVVATLVVAVAMIDSFLCRHADILLSEVPLSLLEQAEPRLRASAWLELSWAHYLDGDRELGAQLAQQAFETFTSLGYGALAYRALAQLTRLHEARPGMAVAAAEAWARLQKLDQQHLPLRTRLFCGISAGLIHRPDLKVEGMMELRRHAEVHGFEALAAIAAINLTDKMLIAGRYEEAVAAARGMLAPGNRLPRARAVILNNLALALIRLDRSPDAYEPARLAFQAMPGVAHFLIDTLALAAAREGRLRDAAVLSGCATRIREHRNEEPDVSEAVSIAETASLLAQGLDPAVVGELKRLGASMSAAEALTVSVFRRPDPATGAS